jgi:hypothetical protein
VEGKNASAGQLALLPVQYSGVSQTSAAARQTVVLGRNESPGHAALLPVQYSAVSQTPAD